MVGTWAHHNTLLIIIRGRFTTISSCPSNPNLIHGVAKEVAKPQHVVVPQIKQRQVTTINNPQYATKSESLQLQVKKCPIDGQHMGAP
jgi:hypothetical protein